MNNLWVFSCIALLSASACQSATDADAIAAAASTGTAAPIPGCDPERNYCPSPLQVRVDRSFSAIPIENQQTAVSQRLTEIRVNGCEDVDECDWRDADGVRHYFWGFSPTDFRVVVKSVHADEFVGRPISALGIGMARQQEDVLTNVRRFLGNVPLTCNRNRVSGNVSPVRCDATLGPGWIQIGFDERGELLMIHFDGYHFT